MRQEPRSSLRAGWRTVTKRCETSGFSIYLILRFQMNFFCQCTSNWSQPTY
jgi:hypothetical protein